MSLLQEARKRPDLEKAAHLTSFSWPSSVALHSQLPELFVHTATVPAFMFRLVVWSGMCWQDSMVFGSVDNRAQGFLKNSGKSLPYESSDFGSLLKS